MRDEIWVCLQTPTRERVKENELEKEIERAKLSSKAAGGETPPPSPERQATIEALSLSFSSDDLCSICLDRGEP